ncbi:MAG: elongation factor G [Oscillospiraceae bacterium]|nr:elongation factor G [Oscillospiraceae bacterium]
MTANELRNVCLVGHGGSGKTSLVESMLFLTGATDRFGKVSDGNSVCDYDAEEIKRQISISMSMAPVNYNKVKLNVLDAPGNFDFAGEAVCAIRASECAILVGAAKDGLSVGMERSWKLLGKKPRMFFINRTDEDNSDYATCLDAIKAKFGTAVVPVVVPVMDGNKKVTAVVDLLHNKAYECKGGKVAACAIPADVADEVEALRAELMEAAAGADEELMEKFFETMELTDAEMAKGLKIGVREGSIAPVLCGSAMTGLGVEMLMQTIIDLVPVATDMGSEAGEDDDGNAVEVAIDPNGTTAAIVFKTISDQYGKYSLVKVVRGKVTSDMSLMNVSTGNTEKLGRLYVIKGKKTEEVKEICCGDIAAIGKMDRVKTGDTLCDPKAVVKLEGLKFAEPCYERAISPASKNEIEKLGTGLNKLNEEDPTFHVVNNAETHQTVISGAGDIQIDVLCAKLKSRFGVAAELDTPRVAYREKIRSTVRKQGRYKKQTGGSGQFGDVHIIFEPQAEQEEMIFEENVFGGSVPKNFFPAVEKGLRESCLHGVLAGYPVVYLKATLVDGSYHPVDSSEIAFKLAAGLAFKAALPEAKPVLMEPIGELKVTIPDAYMGDVMGDLNKRRGRVMGMNPTGDGEQILEAEVPMAEMMSYAIDLRSMTQSRGSFTFKFIRYEDCPGAAQEKAIAEAKALAEAE